MPTLTRIVPGFDCRFAPCNHPTPGEHGICGERVIHAVTRELADGRKVALSLEIGTDAFPPTVPNHWAQPRDAPRARRVQLHVQQLGGEPCEVLAGFNGNVLGCFVPWDGYSAADEFQPLLCDKRAVHSAEIYEAVKKPSQDFWRALEAKLLTLLGDPTLFQQPDETPTMIDVRTRHEQAQESLAAAQRRAGTAQTELDDACRAYVSGDPGFRRR